jgi:hypothetical protein
VNTFELYLTKKLKGQETFTDDFLLTILEKFFMKELSVVLHPTDDEFERHQTQQKDDEFQR